MDRFQTVTSVPNNPEANEYLYEGDDLGEALRVAREYEGPGRAAVIEWLEDGTMNARYEPLEGNRVRTVWWPWPRHESRSESTWGLPGERS